MPTIVYVLYGLSLFFLLISVAFLIKATWEHRKTNTSLWLVGFAWAGEGALIFLQWLSYVQVFR